MIMGEVLGLAGGISFFTAVAGGGGGGLGG